LPEIDNQHQALFGMINDLWHTIIDRSSSETVTIVLTKLERYTILHFEAEEDLMRSLGYPRLDAHRKAHQIFVQRIKKEKQKQIEGRTAGLAMLHFLNDWLVEHILTLDRDYANYFERKRQPRSWLARLLPL
jgi:hemerythrin-like metal-binding protein